MKNLLGNILTEAAKLLASKSDQHVNRNKIANHSARKTSISTLLDNNMHPIHVHQLSGHKRLESLSNYHVASNEKQIQMSRILGNADCGASSSLVSAKVRKHADIQDPKTVDFEVIPNDIEDQLAK